MNLNRYIDHTLLKSFATKEDIIKLCSEAIENNFYSVCVNPCDITLCKELLKNSGVKVCTVIGFPLGRNTTEIKIKETEIAFNDGCDEFDMVINVGELKNKNYEYVESEIAKIVKTAKGRVVKVIIESGLLTDEEIVVATKLSCKAGADFVKTCTGFTGGVATEQAVKLMKANVVGKTKVKASGGIRNYNDAITMIKAGADRLGTSAGVEIAKGK